MVFNNSVLIQWGGAGDTNQAVFPLAFTEKYKSVAILNGGSTPYKISRNWEISSLTTLGVAREVNWGGGTTWSLAIS